jgi:Uma2 family endonuclease
MGSGIRLVTAGELERRPRDDSRYELVAGRLVRMSPSGCQHSGVVVHLLYLLEEHVRRTPVGRVLTDLGFKLASRPDTVRAPDVAFVREDRWPSSPPKGFFDGPPDLAVEVRSADEGPWDLLDKADEYLSRGVLVVVLVDPDERRVTCCRRLTPPVALESDDRLDLDDVVAGFSCRVDDIFP